jgi:two-component sensor histidine kinase
MPVRAIKLFSPEVLNAVMHTLPVGLILAHATNLEIVAISEPACQLLGRPRSELERKPLAHVIRGLKLISPRGEVADLAHFPIARACTLGEVVRGEQWSIEGEDGQRPVVLVNAAPIYGEDGCILGGIAAWTDVTSLKAVEQDLRDSIAAEAVLLRESNHRIKNHLQMLAGLVQIEARRPGTTAHALASSMVERFSVLAATHEGFYSARHRGSVNATWLLERVGGALNTSEHPILTSCPSDLDFDDRQVTPVALVINESISNALKHAFPDEQPGRIFVSLGRDGDMIVLDIADEGTGLPDQGIKQGLGTQILGSLARQLKGTFALENGRAGGAVVRLRFPEGRVPLRSDEADVDKQPAEASSNSNGA